MKIKSYKFPVSVKQIVCSDLDETFLPFDDARKPDSGIAELEQFLLDHIEKKSLIFGWITGSNLQSALRKTAPYITRCPHFIASSLGTEFHWIRNGEIIEPESWKERILTSGFKLPNIDLLISELKKKDIHLEKEPDDYQGKYKATFYYYIKNSIETDFSLIEKLANDYQIKVLFNKSNPMAGDPENCYDIEFLPAYCGKGEIVDFLLEELNITANNCYCFGDSFNDFSMFSRTKNAFLVGNADPEARSKHQQVLERNYCYGICDKLKEIFNAF